jgi:uncharacterized membrane protein/mono/diheme cytochrome c family protein
MTAQAGAVDAWMDLVGRLHPLMVHFPVALVVVAALVELWSAVRRHEGPSPFALTSVWFAAVFGVAAACSGWANAAYGGESTSVDLFLHRWGGVAVAGVLVALAITGTNAARAGHAGWSGLWRMGLVLCAGMVAVVGHFGGNLVHGEGYVTRALWTALRASQAGAPSEPDRATAAPGEEGATTGATAVPGGAGATTGATVAPGEAGVSVAAAAAAYADILPVFEARCFECHGRGKSKAGIRLDEPERLIGQERRGRVMVTPGDPAASSLLAVLTLPVDDELAMPPDGDRLTPDEVAKVRAWIAAGAPLPASPR